ncbi:MAG: hypothetical protein RQ752_09045 [Thermohalobaculum sp.]|nr:hypothetical protein [Thermohalobaculum sp.]
MTEVKAAHSGEPIVDVSSPKDLAMSVMGGLERTKGLRSFRMAPWMFLVLGLLLALAPVLPSHRADASSGTIVTAVLDADSVGPEAAAHPDHATVACHGGYGCTAAATLPDGVMLAVLDSGQQHFGLEPLAWSARPIRPDIKPPIL